MITKFCMELLFFITKKLLFLTIAEKRQMTETAIFGGCGFKTAVGGGGEYFYQFIITIKNYM
ncbi:MAG: hypothetical protein GY738_16960 [Pseudoalteromonas sp.]|nr:hypothetical protein [Pseudoalteromonas sp.]